MERDSQSGAISNENELTCASTIEMVSTVTSMLQGVSKNSCRSSPIPEVSRSTDNGFLNNSSFLYPKQKMIRYIAKKKPLLTKNASCSYFV